MTAGKSRMLGFLVFMYAFTAYGVSGIPGLARSAFVFSLLMAVVLFTTGKIRWIQSLILLPGLFFALSFLNCIDVPVPGDAFNSLIMLGASLFGAVVVTVSGQAMNSLKPALDGILAGCFLNIAAVSFGFEIDLNSLEAGRATGLTGNSNALAVRLFFGAFLVWTTLGPVGRTRLILAAFLPVYAFSETGSRKAILMLPFFMFTVLVRLFPKRNCLSASLVACLVASCIFAISTESIPLPFQNNLAISRMTQVFEGSESSASLRENYIESALKLWLMKPIFGHGLNQFRNLSGVNTYSHNNFTELLVSGGILLTGAYYSIHLFVFYLAWRRKVFTLVAPAMACLLFSDSFMVSYYEKVIWLFLLCALSSMSLKTTRLDIFSNRSRRTLHSLKNSPSNGRSQA